jgi:hypothetical protein
MDVLRYWSRCFDMAGSLVGRVLGPIRETLENPVTLRKNGPVIGCADWLHGGHVPSSGVNPQARMP